MTTRYDSITQKLVDNGIVKNDANSTLFSTAQLTEQEAAFVAYKRLNVESAKLMKPRTVSPGASTYEYRTHGATNGAVQAADGVVITPSDLSATQLSMALVHIRDAFTLSDTEMRQASLTGQPLETFGAQSCSANIQDRMDQYAMIGDGTRLGLLNATGTSTYVIPADGSGTSALWSTKTGALMYRDVVETIEKLTSASSGKHVATKCVLGAARLATLKSTKYNDYSVESVFDKLTQTYPGVQFLGTYFMADTAVTITHIAGKVLQGIVAVDDSEAVNFGNVVGMLPTITGSDYNENVVKFQAVARASGCAVNRPQAICIALPASLGI